MPYYDDLDINTNIKYIVEYELPPDVPDHSMFDTVCEIFLIILFIKFFIYLIMGVVWFFNEVFNKKPEYNYRNPTQIKTLEPLPEKFYHKKLENLIPYYISKCCKKFNSSVISRIENIKITPYEVYINFYDEESNTAGYYQPHTKKIFINTHSIKEMEDTLKHELAHQIDYSIRKMSCHDSFWQNIYEALGGTEKYVEEHLKNRS